MKKNEQGEEYFETPKEAADALMAVLAEFTDEHLSDREYVTRAQAKEHQRILDGLNLELAAINVEKEIRRRKKSNG